MLYSYVYLSDQDLLYNFHNLKNNSIFEPSANRYEPVRGGNSQRLRPTQNLSVNSGFFLNRHHKKFLSFHSNIFFNNPLNGFVFCKSMSYS